VDRHIEICTEPLWVEGDATRLAQVLTNIVTNAIKYTPPAGRIRVALHADGGDAVLSVEDNGFGISPGLLPAIFDMYVQADRTLQRARGGLGIGLTLVAVWSSCTGARSLRRVRERVRAAGSSSG
jgi:signal transduction histidine kinase